MNQYISDFNVKAKSWDSDPAKISRAKSFADAIAGEIRISPSFTGFEYGCGTGLVSFFLHSQLSRIVMADSSDGMLEVLKAKLSSENITNMFPINLDLTQANPPEEKFDLIYTLMTIHHILDTDRILAVFRSMLKDGGHLCIADLDKEDGSFHGTGFHGHNGFDRTDLKTKAGKAGYGNIGFKTLLVYDKAVNFNEKKAFPIFFMTAEKK